jgi:ubiquinone/menaquinone biosynthesis C-methylase UbiE
MIAGRGAVARLAADLTAVDASDHVVDIGCGPGVAAREAARRGATVAGVDPAPVMLRLARVLTRSGLTVTWVEGAAEAIPLRAASATVVWSIATVHHWQDLDVGLAEVRRVLGPGGRFLVMERHLAQPKGGHGGHGWTDEQAAIFVERCEQADFADLRVDRHAGRRPMIAVQATAG